MRANSRVTSENPQVTRANSGGHACELRWSCVRTQVVIPVNSNEPGVLARYVLACCSRLRHRAPPAADSGRALARPSFAPIALLRTAWLANGLLGSSEQVGGATRGPQDTTYDQGCGLEWDSRGSTSIPASAASEV